ncbi:MAG: ankyrin repeat domain-containing protein [Thermoguttaceae bacterium]|nr:ankyrin repeat domain-containing protein [Thermoguttaceae bacterium]
MDTAHREETWLLGNTDDQDASDDRSFAVTPVWQEMPWEEEGWTVNPSMNPSMAVDSEPKGGASKAGTRRSIRYTLPVIFSLLAVGGYGWLSIQTEFDGNLFSQPWQFSWNRPVPRDEASLIRDSEIHSLTQAAELGRVEVVQKMLRDGVSATQKDENGNTALHLAAQRGFVEVMKVLLDAGADPNATNTVNNTALLSAVSNLQSEEVVALLLKYGAKIPTSYDSTGGNTELHFAARCGNSDTCELLLDAGADINARNGQGETALFFAIDSKDSETTQFLIDRGADVRVQDNLERTPLCHAANVGDLSVIGTLIAAGAELNTADSDGNTPLHIATLQRHDEVIALFITAGADVTIKNRDGMEPIQVIPWNIPHEKQIAIRQAFLDAGATASAFPANPWAKMASERNTACTFVSVRPLVQPPRL